MGVDGGLLRDGLLCWWVDIQMREFSEKLGKFGITLASNQFEYSLVNRDAEADGTLAECQRLGESRNARLNASRSCPSPQPSQSSIKLVVSRAPSAIALSPSAVPESAKPHREGKKNGTS